MRTARYTFSELSQVVKDSLNSHTFMGSCTFAGLWRTAGGNDVYWVVEHEGAPLVALSSVEFGTGPLKRLQIMPDGCYGAPALIDSSSDQTEVVSCALKAVSDAGYARVIASDFYGAFSGCDGFDTTECQTTIVDISTSDWKPPDKKIQSEIRKAEREGIGVEKFDASKHMGMFIELVESTERRHGRKPKYSPEFFAALADIASVDDRVYWAIVEAEGKAAASHIYFIENDMIMNWQVYFDKAFSYLKPNQFLLFDTARGFAARGAKTLNLGASPEGAEGLVSQKSKWGGQTKTYSCLIHKSMLGRMM